MTTSAEIATRRGRSRGFAVRGRPRRGRPLESSASLSGFSEQVKKNGNQIHARSASDAGSSPTPAAASHLLREWKAFAEHWLRRRWPR